MPRISTPIALFCGVLAVASTSRAEDWTAVAPMPGPGRHHPVNFTLDGYGYMVTGSAASASYTQDFFRYDPVADEWETLPDFPGPARSYSYGGSFEGKGYLGFGLGTGYLKDLWEYDPVTGVWTELASCPGTARTHPAFVITEDGKIFVGVGGSAGGNLRDWWEYDIATDAWTEKAFLPGPARHHPYYWNIGDTPYVAFGHGAGIFRDVYRWERDTETWTRLSDIPAEGRVAGTQFSLDGYGYALSGEGEDHRQLDYGEFWRYDPTTDTWLELPPHPGAGRWAPGNFVIDGTVYLMGGLTPTRLETDMWKFDLPDPADVELPQTTLQSSFQVYPNPVTGTRLRISDLPAREAAGSTLQLLGADGRLVTTLEPSEGQIAIPDDLVSGRYYVVLRGAGGEQVSRSVTVLR